MHGPNECTALNVFDEARRTLAAAAVVSKGLFCASVDRRAGTRTVDPRRALAIPEIDEEPFFVF